MTQDFDFESIDLQDEWSLADHKIHGKMILAPMEGYSDQPYRLICREMGASSLSVTEFINAIDIVNGHPYLVKNRIRFLQTEHPISIQIFDNEPERLVKAAQKIMSCQPDFIDINMGCSVKKVSNRGAGAGLLRTPHKIARIFNTLTSELTIPITGKIRLGWDEHSLNYLEVAHIIEDCGGSAIAVHARTRAQGYTGKANWDAIAEIKQMVSIPVIGNGDISSQKDAARMLDYTKCDAVMIGRAAIGNPWIFSQTCPAGASPPTRHEMMIRHLLAMVDFYGETVAVIQFRKHAVAYLSSFSLTSSDRRRLLTTNTVRDFQQVLESLPLAQKATES